MTTAQIYGQIGAAKAFSSSVSNALDLESQANEEEIAQLEAEYNNTSDEQVKKKLNRKIKRLKRKNKMQNATSKASNGVTDFLTKIAAYMDIGVRILIEWIAHFIVYVLPALEAAVKILLLTNIKKMVSCAIDPRIPDEYREEGILLNEAEVDPRAILRCSPYSNWGKYKYFGCFYDKDYALPKPVNELARADDMNAFLWFAKNCAKFVSSHIIIPSEMGTYFENGSGHTFFDTHEFIGKSYKFIEGTTFKHGTASQAIFLCTRREYANGQTHYTIIPASDSWIWSGSTSINWYKDRTSLTGLERKKINYNKSRPLFNIEYIGSYVDAPFYRDGNFRFRILQKPFSVAGGFVVDLKNATNKISDVAGLSDTVSTELIGSELTTQMPNLKFSGIQSPFPYAARFNYKGIYDKKGKYSINTKLFKVVQEATTENKNKIYFRIVSDGGSIAKMLFDKSTKIFTLLDLNDTQLPLDKCTTILTECYFGKTIYEFNYDYVVSMKLFDSKVIASEIVDALMNINLPNPFQRGSDEGDEGVGGNRDQMIIDSFVDKLVEKMIDTEDGEYTDCFYTFSNEDYEKMEESVINAIANNTLITYNTTNEIKEVYDILDAYDADATLNEQDEIITKALLKAASVCGYDDNLLNNTNALVGSGLPNDSSGGKSGLLQFIMQAVQCLIGAVVNGLLTPKVLMLIQINRILMNQNPIPQNKEDLKNRYTLTVTDVLDGLSGLLKGIIREVIDTILKELIKLILERLGMMMAAYLKKLGLEYAMKWVDLLRQIISCFKRNKNKIGEAMSYDSQNMIQNIVDNVDYADIDVMLDEIIPNTNPC